MKTISKLFTVSCFLIIASTTVYAQNLEKGIKLFEAKRYNASKEFFHTALNENPKNGLTHYYIGEICYYFGKMDSASFFFQQGLKLDPKQPLNYVGLGKILLDEDKSEEAKLQFQEAQMLSQKKETVLIKIAEAYLEGKSKNFEEALYYVNEAKKISPNEPLVYITLGDVYVKKNDGSNAISNYEKALELNPNFAKAYDRIGQIYVMSKNFEEAEINFGKALSIDPEYAPSYKEIAELLYQMKQYTKAIDSYKTYIDLVGNEPEALKRYASFLFISKKYSETIRIIEEHFKDISTNNNLQKLLAYSYYETGNYSQGLSTIENYLSGVSPNKITAGDYEYYGKLLFKNGKDSMAVLNFEKAINSDPLKLEIHNALAEIYFNQKKYSKAAEEYQLKFNKLKSAPSAVDLFELGRSYYFYPDYGKADSVFALVISKVPDRPTGYLWRARANSNLDPESEKGLAQSYYEQFITKVTDSEKERYKNELIEAHSYLGYLFYLKKDFTNSKINWQNVKLLEPENVKAREALKVLK